MRALLTAILLFLGLSTAGCQTMAVVSFVAIKGVESAVLETRCFFACFPDGGEAVCEGGVLMCNFDHCECE